MTGQHHISLSLGEAWVIPGSRTWDLLQSLPVTFHLRVTPLCPGQHPEVATNEMAKESWGLSASHPQVHCIQKKNRSRVKLGFQIKDLGRSLCKAINCCESMDSSINSVSEINLTCRKELQRKKICAEVRDLVTNNHHKAAGSTHSDGLQSNNCQELLNSILKPLRSPCWRWMARNMYPGTQLLKL